MKNYDTKKNKKASSHALRACNEANYCKKYPYLKLKNEVKIVN